jgi:hypothetical protein
MTPRFHRGPARAQLPLRVRPIQEQFSRGGTLWSQFFRSEAGYLLRFPGLADFEVTGDGAEVRCQPAQGISDDSIEHLFLNQVVPLALSRSRLILHAGAVAVDRTGLAFMGESGKGKSTLVASFAGAGFPVLTDEALCLVPGERSCLALPSHPSIRMWNDSQQALVPPGAACASPVGHTPKARLLAGDFLPFCREAKALDRIYVLGDGTSRDVEIEQLSPSAALLALVRNSFVLEVDRAQFLASHFDRLAELTSRIGFWRLDYPRRFEMLAQVRTAILDHFVPQSVDAPETAPANG